MDRERLGRALGQGTRGAANTLARIAEAALAPDPATAGRPLRHTENRPVGRNRQPSQRSGLRQRVAAIWSPAARASRVLWLECTGSFFALFALAMAVEAWKRRAGFAADGRQRDYAWVAVLLLAVFTWFAVSSFVQARRRARR